MRRIGRLLRWLRGALGTAVTWAVLWALGGVGIGATSLLTPFLPWERFFAVFDAPLPALAVPGFVGGLVFAGVLRVAARRRPLAQLSTRQFAWWGAVGGGLLAMVPTAMVMTGFSYQPGGAAAVWSVAAIIATPLIALASASAALTCAVAKRGETRAAVGDVSERLVLGRREGAGGC